MKWKTRIVQAKACKDMADEAGAIVRTLRRWFITACGGTGNEMENMDSTGKSLQGYGGRGWSHRPNPAEVVYYSMRRNGGNTN